MNDDKKWNLTSPLLTVRHERVTCKDYGRGAVKFVGCFRV